MRSNIYFLNQIWLLIFRTLLLVEGKATLLCETWKSFFNFLTRRNCNLYLNCLVGLNKVIKA